MDKERKNRDIETVRLEIDDIDIDSLLENSAKLGINMGISSIIGTRENQQDSVFGQAGENVSIAIVCDGMGGLNGGERASQTALKILAEDFFGEENIENMPEFFEKEAYKMDEEVFKLTDEEGEPLNAGTTVVAVVVKNNEAYWLSVGDSKIYIIREDEIIPVNREHNYRLVLDERLKNGEIDEETYKSEEKQAEALISYIGIGDLRLMDINKKPFELLENDIILLCSDGLYKRLKDEEIIELIKYEEPDMKRAAKRLTDIVMKRTVKSQDNTSIVLMQYGKLNSDLSI
ncbi:MAG: serine/threonine-protein phosphatase [Lachnospiraceae bacterium]|nr:serine/threonine-protein phosphatase [Lachnospiraceae bacterium]